ncbi:MAG: DNA mismatch repair endonuclease MutL [Syntrophaceae bacterium]|nr:DNA mismatch repair endonuclease MutL [Syntrophaceae bacterium]
MAGKIHILPDHVSQIIAAGEVVERPASVVKELMENAIDAGSTEILVELKAGGLQLIRVVDNGEGMEKEDVPRAFQRYATSKIRNAEDLYAIHTLGFRGEALPSISEVSKISLQTRPLHSLSGTEAICEGGKIKRISEVGCPVGTEVSVKDIFYNLPVKRKFLKSIRSELRYALLHFLRLSLSHASISFKFVHDGRVLHEHPETPSALVRIEAILGKEIYSHLRPIEIEDREIKIAGFASLPSFSKRNAEGLYFYVNQRFIKDRMIYKAVVDAYHHTLPNHQFPIVILFISIPPSTVDVNIHPTKAEVKFRDPERIYQTILACLRGVVEEGSFRPAERLSWVERRGDPFQKDVQPSFFIREPPSPTPFLSYEKGEPVPMVQEGERPPWKVVPSASYAVVGQIQGTYILCEGEGKLIFIDQHAAHERILFEKFKKEYESRSVVSEKLLFPILLEVSSEESSLLESGGEALRAMGFDIEPAGEKLYVIRSVPSFIEPKDSQDVVRGILEDLSFLEGVGRGEETLHAILVTLACHSAIRGNFPLKKEEADKLIEFLAPFSLSTTCPHGRPIFFILPLDELKKQFKRR